MPEPVIVRAATGADLRAVAAIYAHAVHHSHATFDVEAPAPETWQQKFASGPGLHARVAADPDGAVIGFAYSSHYRPRAAYDRTRETSVYLAQDARGRGVGRLLYDDLLPRLRYDGVHVVLAAVALPNPASEALHRSCGFRRVGVLPEVGFKFGRWIDVAFLALRWDDDDGDANAQGRPTTLRQLGETPGTIR